MHSISILGKNSDVHRKFRGRCKSLKMRARPFDYFIKNHQNCKGPIAKVRLLRNGFFHIAESFMKAKVPYIWKTLKGNLVKDSIKKKIEIQYHARNLEIKPEPRIDVDKLFKFLSNGKSIY